MSSVKKLAIRGTLWTIAGYGASQILRFGSNLLLTRLVAPDVFGLMALVYVFIMGLHLFSDIGIGPSLIQNKRGEEPDFYNTAWTMQVVRAVVLWLCCLLIAWPVSTFYEKPILFPLISVVALTTLIEGFKSTALFTLNRQIAVSKLAIFEFGGQVVGTTVMIALAWYYHNVWAIVIGNIASSTIQLVWSHWLLIPGLRNRFVWDRSAAKSIFSFGKWIFVSTAVTFLAEQSDRLILGKLISSAALGVYGIAFTLSDIPRSILMAISSKVLFPAFSRFVDLPREEFRAKILKNRMPFLIATTFGVTLLTCFGDKLITVLYPDKYKDAAWMLPLLAIGFWPRILTQTIDQALFAIGKPRYSAYGCFLKSLYMVIGLPLGFHLMGGSQGHGLLGAIIVIAFNDIPFYGAIAYGLWREKLTSVVQDIKATALFLVLLTIVLISRYALGLGLPIDGLLNK
jgi:O-antigen/teichoic acid export membrane protein